MTTFDQVKNKKRRLVARLGGVQKRIQNDQGHGGIRRLEGKLQKEFSEILKKEELMWFQRSRAKWLI